MEEPGLPGAPQFQPEPGEEDNIENNQITSSQLQTNNHEELLEFLRERLDVLPVDHDKNFRNQEQGCYEEKGNMELDIPNYRDDSGWFQKRSILNVVHVRSGTGGKMVIKALARDVLATDPTQTMFYWRYLLLRTNQIYASYPVDLICKGHQIENDKNVKNILRPLPGQGKSHLVEDEHPSLLFQTHPMTGNELTEVGKLGSIEDLHEFYFSCNDSCVTCSMADRIQSKSAKTMKMAARDLRLVITLEKKTPDGMEVIARRSELVWPKAQVCTRDLEKEERRLPQGGSAQKIRREARAAETTSKAPVNSSTRENLENELARIISSHPDPNSEFNSVMHSVCTKVNLNISNTAP